MKETLRNYLDKRVMLNGAFDCLSPAPYKSHYVALLQDATVTTADGHTVDIGHTWLQDADTLVGFDLKKDDRIACSVRVQSYEKGGQIKFGFRSPTQVERISRPVALRIPQAEEREVFEDAPPAVARDAPDKLPAPHPDEPISPVVAIREVKALAAKLGGMDRLRELVQEM